MVIYWMVWKEVLNVVVRFGKVILVMLVLRDDSNMVSVRLVSV